MKRTTVTLTDELADRLRLEAERRRTSVSEVMRILVAEALGVGSEGKRRTDATVVVLAEKLRTDIVFTLDRRHFAVVRPNHCDRLRLYPRT